MIEEQAEEELFGRSSSRQWSYNERDVPPNQAFQNLEERCRDRITRWKSVSFDEKLQMEMEIAGYLRIMRQLLIQHRIGLPGVEQLNIEELNRLEGLHNREVLASMIKDSKKSIQQLQWGKDNAKRLFEAFEDLVEHDPRVNPVLREQLKATIRPVAYQEALQQIAAMGGYQSPLSTSYLISEPERLGQPVGQLIAQRKEGNYSTALVRIDDNSLTTYVRSYYKLEVIFKALHKKIEDERRQLQELGISIEEHGGHLSQAEKQRLAQFEQGRDPNRNIGVYTAYLDYLRFMAETLFRHGRDFPGAKR